MHMQGRGDASRITSFSVLDKTMLQATSTAAAAAGASTAAAGAATTAAAAGAATTVGAVATVEGGNGTDVEGNATVVGGEPLPADGTGRRSVCPAVFSLVFSAVFWCIIGLSQQCCFGGA